MNIERGNFITKLDNGLDKFDKHWRAAYIYINVYDDGKTWSVDVFRDEHGGCAKSELKRGLWTDREEAEKVAAQFVLNTDDFDYGLFRGIAPNF